MRAKFEAAPRLEERVAWMVAPKVAQVARQVGQVAKRLAPPGKTWVSMGDRNVRDTHMEAHSHPMIPGNLRFEVRSQPWDLEHGLSKGPHDYLLEPKDTSTGLPLDSVQHVHCRCTAALHPTFLSEKVRVSGVRVYGTEISAVVSCTAYKVIEAEWGESYPTGDTAPGTRFMGRAASRVAGNGGMVRGYDVGVGTGARAGGEDN